MVIVMLKAQKQIASRVLGCGTSRVWLDPARMKDVEEAITADDIRRLIKDGVIKASPKTGISNFRKNKVRLQKAKGRRKGKGSKKGMLGTRLNKKRIWVKRIRIIRNTLNELRESGKIDKPNYRKLYMMAKSGFFRSRSHFMLYIEKGSKAAAKGDKR